jgi:hypothetical protein
MRRNWTAISPALVLSVCAGTALTQDDTPLDLERVTLYRSGVGSFEWRGSVEGDEDIALRFGREQINDILKSMVLLDMGGGRIEAVGYDSKEPMERRLAGFAIDVQEASSLYGLLGQLKGTRVRLDVLGTTIQGVVIGLENRQEAQEGGTISVGYVNLLTERGVRSIDLRQVVDLEILDERLARELRDALAAMAESSGEDAATVDLRFRGDGVRPVAVSYVHEAPVWKTSYRLVLPDDSSGGRATLQGWAIVENTTDADWRDVRMTLVSGRPVGFTMDLYQPLYIERPEVPVPIEMAAGPRVYERGMERKSSARGGGAMADSAEWEAASPAPSGAFSRLSSEQMANNAPSAMATGQTAGELFVYELDQPVTIERRRSAMLPILSSGVEARRVSIYNENDLAAHPMRGVEVTNASGLRLMPGPVSVYDAGNYAGDAQIGSAGEGESRLLAYAVDLDVSVQTKRESVSELTAASIRGSVLRRTRSQRETVTYTMENNADDGRTVLVEVPKRGGWSLAGKAKPAEETQNAYRFEVEIGPDKTRELTVTLERVWEDAVGIADHSIEMLIRELRGARVSKEVVEALDTAAKLQAAVDEAQQRLNRLDAERDRIAQEQGRIRENMGSVSRDTDLYRRYLNTLEQQEDRLDAIRGERQEAEAALESARARLRSYLAGLRIG